MHSVNELILKIKKFLAAVNHCHECEGRPPAIEVPGSMSWTGDGLDKTGSFVLEAFLAAFRGFLIFSDNA